jgi:hypothetical protein
MKNSQLLRSKGFPVQGDEEKLRMQLENLDNLLKQPSEFTDKLNPLWSQIQQIRDHQDHTTDMPEKWALVSEKDVQAVSEVRQKPFFFFFTRYLIPSISIISSHSPLSGFEPATRWLGPYYRHMPEGRSRSQCNASGQFHDGLVIAECEYVDIIDRSRLRAEIKPLY